MNLLLIDSTKPVLYVALAVDGTVVASQTCAEQRQHDRHINRLIRALPTQNFDAVAVVTGPGSWTGIRVGLAVAKAYAYVQHIPVVALTDQPDVAVAMQQWQQGAGQDPFSVRPFYNGEFIVNKNGGPKH